MKTVILQRSSIHRHLKCTRCGSDNTCRHSKKTRRIHHLNTDHPVEVRYQYSYHFCLDCNKYFGPALTPYAGVGDSCRYSLAVREKAIEIYNDNEVTLQKCSELLFKGFNVRVPPTTIHDWWALVEEQKHEEVVKRAVAEGGILDPGLALQDKELHEVRETEDRELSSV
jgi:hypothetical protein